MIKASISRAALERHLVPMPEPPGAARSRQRQRKGPTTTCNGASLFQEWKEMRRRDGLVVVGPEWEQMQSDAAQMPEGESFLSYVQRRMTVKRGFRSAK